MRPAVSSHLVYRSEIDGLRAVAVIAVILFHAGFSAFKGGYVGVDIFFVISGYLITSIIVKDLKAGSFSFWDFYERRARRILPVLFLVIVSCIPFAWLWMTPMEMKAFSTSVAYVSFFLSNILFWQQSGYFDTASELKPLLHTWSLAVEEQFYIVFPIAIFALSRYGRNRVIWSIVLVFLLSIALSEYSARQYSSFNFFWLPTRAWELMAGALCSFVVMKPRAELDNFLSVVGFAAITSALVMFDEALPFPSLYALIPVLGACAVVLFARPGTLVYSLLSLRPIVGIGLISYSAYLWHQPIFAFVRLYSRSEPSSIVMLLLVISTLALAYLSWRFVETPIRKLSTKSVRARVMIFSSSLIASLSLVIFALFAISSNGMARQRFPSLFPYFDTATSSPKRDECHVNRRTMRVPSRSCEYFGRDVRIATFGDSHTVELAYALADKLRYEDIAIKHFSISGCAPSYGRVANDYDHCSRWTTQTLEYLASRRDIPVVVVSFAINMHLFKMSGPPSSSRIEDISNDQQAIWRSYVGSIDFLQAHGKHVVLVLQSPRLTSHVEWLVYRSSINAKDIIGKTRDIWNGENQFVLMNVHELEKTGVKVVDPAGLFCDERNCYAGRNGVSYYFDDNHPSIYGASLIADAVAETIKRMGWLSE